MASFQIEWKRSALKELQKLPRQTISKIVSAVGDLAEQPFPPGMRKLVGTEHTYRLRVGDYRVIYDVFQSKLTVEIVRIRHRKDAYK
jgi:mRNA interferase RelE/StbE